MSHADQIENAFTYHRPTTADVMLLDSVRTQAKDLALALDTLCPNSREKSLAITKLEEAVMWANAAIVRHSADVNARP